MIEIMCEGKDTVIVTTKEEDLGEEIVVKQKVDGLWYWSCADCNITVRCFHRERVADFAIFHSHEAHVGES